MKLKETLFDLLFPPRCALCGRRGVKGLCTGCVPCLDRWILTHCSIRKVPARGFYKTSQYSMTLD